MTSSDSAFALLASVCEAAASTSSSINSSWRTKQSGPERAGPNGAATARLKTEYVLIVGTQAWFQCFEQKQQPGTGLGAACEADDIRQRIYKAGGVIDNIRVVLFDDADAAHIPPSSRYHRFHAERDFENIVRWLGGTIPSNTRHSAHFDPAQSPFAPALLRTRGGAAQDRRRSRSGEPHLGRAHRWARRHGQDLSRRPRRLRCTT